MKRMVPYLLLMSMLASVCACGDTPSEPIASSDNDETTTGEVDLFEGLDTVAYQGRTFHWLIPDYSVYNGDIYVGEATGEVYDDAVYERGKRVEDRFGVTIDPIYAAYSWSLRDEYLNRVRTSVQASDHAYDLVATQAYILPTLMMEEMLAQPKRNQVAAAGSGVVVAGYL